MLRGYGDASQVGQLWSRAVTYRDGRLVNGIEEWLTADSPSGRGPPCPFFPVPSLLFMLLAWNSGYRAGGGAITASPSVRKGLEASL